MRPFCVSSQNKIRHALSRMAKTPAPTAQTAPNRGQTWQTITDRRKIDPSRGATLGDGTPNDNDRIEIGPTQLAFRE